MDDNKLLIYVRLTENGRQTLQATASIIKSYLKVLSSNPILYTFFIFIWSNVRKYDCTVRSQMRYHFFGIVDSH